MDENLQEGIELFSKCCDLIRASDNEGVKYATEQIDSFVTDPFSINVLIHFIQNQKDYIIRQFGLISLKCAIKNCWSQILLETQNDLFVNLLNLVISETVWVNRYSLIVCIKEAMSSEFDEPLLNFIKQAFSTDSDEFLEVALILAGLIPSDEDKLEECSPLIPFFTEMFIKGLESDQPEVRLSGLYFLCYSKIFKDAHFFEQSPEQWDNVIELFDSFITQSQQLNRLIDYIDDFIQDKRYTGDITSLLVKLMSLYTAESSLEENQQMNVHRIIQSICKQYAEYLSTNELLEPLIELHISISFQLYNSEDSLALSNAHFFEETFRSLCVNQQAIDALWSICLSHSDSNEGLFVFLRAVASTFDNAPEYYIKNKDEITEILSRSILSNSLLLRDAAARTADELITYYVFESDELSIALAPIVVKACHEHVSEYLLIVCSHILDTTKKTEEYFDDTFPFLLDLIQNSPMTDVQDAALQCLGSLAKWSTNKIDRNFESILPILIELLKSSACHQEYLKTPTVDFIGKLAKAVGSPLDEFLVLVIPFFIENMESEDASLSFSCMMTIKLIIQSHPETIADKIDEIIPKLMKKASTEISKEMMDAANSPSFESDQENPFTQTIYKIPGLALQVLGSICQILKNTDEEEELWGFVYKCLKLHKKSYNEFCLSSVTITISSLMKGISDRYESSGYDENKIFPIILRFIRIIFYIFNEHQNMEVNVDIFRTIKDTVSYFDYESLKQENYLNEILDITSQFLTPEIAFNYRPKKRSRDVYNEILDFLINFIISAGTEAFEYLTKVTDQYLEMLHDSSSNLRFRSFAIRYFSYLITNSNDLPDELQRDVVVTAIQMTKEENDYGALIAIQQMAMKLPRLMIPYQDEILEVLMEKLNMPFITQEKMLLLRDNCVIALAAFVKRPFYDFKEIDFEKCAPIILKALPIAKDFQEYNKMDFVLKLFTEMYDSCKDSYPDLFLRVLVVTFANPKPVLDEMKFSKLQLLKNLHELMEKIPNATDLCVQFLNNDPSKLANLEDILNNGY